MQFSSNIMPGEKVTTAVPEEMVSSSNLGKSNETSTSLLTHP
jgi:hypothetical protein